MLGTFPKAQILWASSKLILDHPGSAVLAYITMIPWSKPPTALESRMGMSRGDLANRRHPWPSLIAEGDFQTAATDAAVRKGVLQVFGSPEGLYTIVGHYFSSVHLRVTIVSKTRFMERLARFNTSATADFATLCLAMNLAIQQPTLPTANMRSSLYVQLKSIVGVLDALDCHTLESLQSRLLLGCYELGHGMLFAASVTIAACARVARFINLDLLNGQPAQTNFDSVATKERRRVWWALVNLDR